MLTALISSAAASPALASAALFAHGPSWHLAFFPLFFLIPVFWILVIALIVVLVTRGRRRAWARGGYGPWGGPWGHGSAGTRSAEATLALRYANGDIDEKEYRARLEVLRAANGPTPPQG
ncbi:SHOCT domain-containing protein [Pseudolysinimonas sp.]|uniref:SHOCT domain-containing protein n=1 Tax=Pseudolysinimonas sp. TaxID=2680009 RepID=UPI003F7E15AF